jgi:hypothetical protein
LHGAGLGAHLDHLRRPRGRGSRARSAGRVNHPSIGLVVFPVNSRARARVCVCKEGCTLSSSVSSALICLICPHQAQPILPRFVAVADRCVFRVEGRCFVSFFLIPGSRDT